MPMPEVALFDVQCGGHGRLSICHDLLSPRRFAASLHRISASGTRRKYNLFKDTWKRDDAEKTADECEG